MQKLSLQLYNVPTGTYILPICELKNLHYLCVHSCHSLIDDGIKYISSLSNLCTLELTSCEITESFAQDISGLVELCTLKLRHCTIQNEFVMDHLNKIINLQFLDLCHSRPITHNMLTHINKFKNLKQLIFESRFYCDPLFKIIDLPNCKIIYKAYSDYTKSLIL